MDLIENMNPCFEVLQNFLNKNTDEKEIIDFAYSVGLFAICKL